MVRLRWLSHPQTTLIKKGQLAKFDNLDKLHRKLVTKEEWTKVIDPKYYKHGVGIKIYDGLYCPS